MSSCNFHYFVDVSASHGVFFFFFFIVLITIESCNLVVFFRLFIFLIFLFSDVFQTKQHHLPVEQGEVAFTCAL